MSADQHVLDDLEWRGLIAHSTDLDALREEMDAGPVRFYVGFDPTAPSLHMGNLLQIVTARRLQDAGHVPFALVGGATGMIGDPKDSGERVLNSLDVVKAWVEKVRAQIEPFLSFEGDNAATMVNNYDWTASLSTIDFLRDIGKHFPVNRMLARDTVRTRLESGISYTEFSYVLLQSMDYLNLHRDHGVNLQFGGSDQWGNITGGVELIRRSDGDRVHAIATPLITRSDGTKYGKTEAGALWLDPQMLSPYGFYQFWLNVEDEKVGELLRAFTLLSHAEIEDLEERTAEKPFLRAGQKALAEHMTSMVHGETETRQIQDASTALFGGGALRELDGATLAAALREAGSTEVKASDGIPGVLDLFVATGLSRSKGEARRTVAEGGAYLNNERVEDPDLVPSVADLLGGSWLVLRRGKKNLAGVEVVG
jgi:tyrosyl-tRNA synthetase